MTDARTQAIQEWMQADAARKYWVEREMQLRLYIAEQGFGYKHGEQGSLQDGTHRLDLGNNYKLKLVTGTSYEVKDGPQLDAALVGIRSMPGGYVIQDLVLNRKHTLNKRGYDAAVPEVQRLLLPAIVTKNKSPTLELEGQK